ncbi:beta-phosphoglucomutase [Halanaerobiaceae bacterium Z-7014]|uniref:Beta-phosphoglucomutase n=1 Tax=Halonatronomonas betaini TaxID=2778430 RepID=A0A931AWV1_9FIRM|nr:beta-phosphoglucomutase [Halonatronomonas betaini]MBF8438189.1 beta-phosphoglucomutase [Halonatronomonas betaini]
MSKDYKGIIFDLDGVITETSEYHYQSWQRMADEEGLDFNREVNEKLRGVSRRRSLEIILDDKELTEQEMNKLMDKKNGYYQEYLKDMDENDMLPGAMDLINTSLEKGFKLAIASSSKNAKTVISALKIGDLFETISDGFSVDNPKPAPDLFLFTAEKLELSPEECIVFEDAKAGIDAAQAANMLSVGIGPEERVGHADFRFDTVKEVELEKILKGEK